MNAVEFHHVSKKRKDFIIDDLNITIPKGYITGFVGPNGSGKTTTIQMLMDIVQADQGNIKLFGKSHHHHESKQNIGFVYDDLYMYEELSIKKIKSFIAPLYENWNERLFQKYLTSFELPLKKKIKHFSKGMKMKCSLLFALAHEPEFIIMDEPTSGLDPIFRRELIELLQELMVNDGQTIFLSTHITTDLDRIADHIIFIHEGKVLLQKSMEEIRDQFHLVKGDLSILDADIKEFFVHIKENNHGFTGLYKGDPTMFYDFGEAIVEGATLEDIMYFMTRKES